MSCFGSLLLESTHFDESKETKSRRWLLSIQKKKWTKKNSTNHLVYVFDGFADMLKDSCKSSEQNSQKVALELQELKKKLRDQRKVTERAEADAKK